MAVQDDLTLPDMFRTSPGRTAMFAFVPILLAAVQLANSYVTGLSFFVSVPFATAMVLYAGFSTTYHFARFRRRHLEAELPTAVDE